MDVEEPERLRREILLDLQPLLRDELVGSAWGRALVQVVRMPTGEPAVADIEVEEIVGDEAQVDAAFGGDSARALMPTLAKAVEALCALDGVELDDVRGGTFIRLGQDFVWMVGLVRAPSPRLDRERDELVARLVAKNGALMARFDADRVELDVNEQSLRMFAGTQAVGAARATLLGTFARASRTWGWAWSNESLAQPVRAACASVTDALSERDLWEISTPCFATDEATAWALSAFICDRTGGAGVQRFVQSDGALFVLVRDPQRAAQ